MKRDAGANERHGKRNADMKLFFDIRNPIIEAYNSVGRNRLQTDREERFISGVVPALKDARTMISEGLAEDVAKGTSFNVIREIMSPKEVEVMLIAISTWMYQDPQLTMAGIFLLGKQDIGNFMTVLKKLVGSGKIGYKDSAPLLSAFGVLADEFNAQERVVNPSEHMRNDNVKNFKRV